MTRNASAPTRRTVKGVSKSNLIKECHKRLLRSIKQGFHIESIALIETLMSDRLESLLSTGGSEPVLLKTLGQHLAKIEKLGVLDDSLVRDLQIWNRKRNLAVHELVKIRNQSDTDWNARIRFVRDAAREGNLLLNKLKNDSARTKGKVARKKLMMTSGQSED